MNTFDSIKLKLDSFENNKERKKYLKSIQANSHIGRHDLRRLCSNTMLETNFIDSYYNERFVKKKWALTILRNIFKRWFCEIL